MRKMPIFKDANSGRLLKEHSLVGCIKLHQYATSERLWAAICGASLSSLRGGFGSEAGGRELINAIDHEKIYASNLHYRGKSCHSSQAPCSLKPEYPQLRKRLFLYAVPAMASETPPKLRKLVATGSPLQVATVERYRYSCPRSHAKQPWITVIRAKIEAKTPEPVSMLWPRMLKMIPTIKAPNIMHTKRVIARTGLNRNWMTKRFDKDLSSQDPYPNSWGYSCANVGACLMSELS